MSTKHLILGLAAAALVGSAIGAGHVFAGDDALQVNAAEVGDKLPTIGYRDSYYSEKIPYVVTSAEDNMDERTVPGDIRLNWIGDYLGEYKAEGSDIAYRITVFDAGTTQVIGEAPAYEEDDVIVSFDFNGPEFIDSSNYVGEAIANAIFDEGKVFNPDHYLGFAGQLVDRGGVYADGDTITFLNSYKYDNLFETPNIIDIEGQDTYYVNDDGSLHHTYFSNIPNNWSEKFLEIEFGFFSVGSEHVTDIPAFDPETTPIVATTSMTADGFLQNADILDAFQKAKVYNSNDYYGAVARIAPREGINNNPFVASDWVVFKGSHQYNVEAPTPTDHAVAKSDATNGSTADLAGIFNGDLGAGWQAQDDTGFVPNEPHPIHVIIDLGKTYNISSMTISWERARAEKFDMYIGNPYINWEDPFAEGFMEDWSKIEPTSYNTSDFPTTDWSQEINDLDACGRYILLNLKTPISVDGAAYGYNIFEIETTGEVAEHSYAYYAIKDYLTGLDCEDFRKDSNKAKEVNATLTDLYNKLSDDEHLTLASEMINDVTTYEDRAIYFLERSAYYAAQTSNGAKLIGGDSSTFAPIIATVALLGAAGGAALLLAKSRKRSK